MASRDNTAADAAYWYVPLSRALPAAIVAGMITFNPDHSPQLGFAAFGIFAALSGLATGFLSQRALPKGVERTVFTVHGVISLVAAIVALAAPNAGLGFFLFLVSGWAILTGFLELYAGFRSRGRNASSRDWLFVGALTVVFAIIILIIPPDLRQEFSGAEEGVSGVLSSSVIAVGLLGAYGAIIAVYLVIGALSLKWSAPGTPAATPAGKSAVSETPATPAPQDGNAS